MRNLRLADGTLMPQIGLGTWELRGDACKSAVKNAINLGYTHIDTAWLYQNQREIGQAIVESDINRSNLFITSKIWRTELSYNQVLTQCDEILSQLQMDYVDLLLIHWPSDENIPLSETIEAFNYVQSQGKVYHIILGGLGKKEKNNNTFSEVLRKKTGRCIKMIRDTKANRIMVSLYNVNKQYVKSQIVGGLLANYFQINNKSSFLINFSSY